MKHIQLFKENSSDGRPCLETSPNVCPVCGSEDVEYKMTEDYTQMSPDNVIIDYTCDVCDFIWYSKYIHHGDFITESGDELIANELIPSDLYSEEKIEAKKYNI